MTMLSPRQQHGRTVTLLLLKSMGVLLLTSTGAGVQGERTGSS